MARVGGIAAVAVIAMLGLGCLVVAGAGAAFFLVGSSAEAPPEVSGTESPRAVAPVDVPEGSTSEVGQGEGAGKGAGKGAKGKPAADSTEGMVEIPAGSFRRGSTDGDADEDPVRAVTLNAFWADVHEVTVARYRACVEDGACTPPRHDTPFCREEFEAARNWDQEDRDDHPINCVDWNQALAFCTWEGKRLLTEAEWEYAARGANNFIYAWGNDKPDCSRAIMRDSGAARGCGRNTTWPVGSRPRGVSPFGLHDMSGNVYEWTQDVYNKKFYDRGPTHNPIGTGGGRFRVVRGGSWYNPASLLKTHDRTYNPPGDAFAYVGLRCAR